MTGPRLVMLLASLALAAAAYEVDGAQACAGIGRGGRVSVRGEEALIVWDEARQVEHFVRRAYFDGQREDFGFLVPTPTQPQLAEEPVAVFARLFSLYRAPLRRDARSRSRSTSSGGGARASADVLVLEETTVAGMDAAVLQASDANALDTWLTAHGYPHSAELRDYVRPYVDAQWIITAFRISPGAAGGSFSTSAVRMSFATPRPFFPYSEPLEVLMERRHFRVSIAAPHRMAAYLDRPSGGAREAWRAPAYAGRPAGLHGALSQSLPPASPDGGRTIAGPWLTTFDEPESQRGRLDLFFERDRAQRAITSRITRAVRP
ncbi:MAG: DUF2330 domain-containing protein [Deltaproteobacteria bacterium]|nr:DUF2330 domain-containing protein [Deltaproteobacteria bacterium]